MKIAIDISPLSGGHSVRGVGFYVKGLQEALLASPHKESFTFFTHISDVPTDTDLIHFPYFDPFFVTLPFRKKTKIIVTIHDLTPLILKELFPVGIKGRGKWELQKLLLRSVDHIITDSDSSRNDVQRIANIPVEKITTVYLAANEHYKKTILTDRQVTSLREKYNLPETFILYVGDVTPNKNLPRLVEASLAAQVHLIMVGKALSDTSIDLSHPWNHDLAQVRKQIAGNSSIHRLGFVPTDDLVALYSLATVFCMPSLYEGFGLPVLEAMQSGTPVITAKTGSLPEIGGDAVYYVDPYNASEIATGIKKVVTDLRLQETLRKRGIEQAQKFTWKQTAEQTIKVYEKTLTTNN